MCLPKKDHSSLFNCLNRMEDNGRRTYGGDDDGKQPGSSSNSNYITNRYNNKICEKENNEWNWLRLKEAIKECNFGFDG